MVILVVDNKQILSQENHSYGTISLTGCIYSEKEFRSWVSKTWGVSPDLNLEVLASQAKQGGWACLKVLEF